MGNDFLENLGKTLSETAKSVGEKTDEFIAIQKLRSHQTTLENEVKKNYRDMGEMVFQKFIDGEAFSEEIADICREVMQLQSEIAECKENIAQKKGQAICPACGASAPKDADFCMRCGSPIPKPEKTEDAEFAEAGGMEDDVDMAGAKDQACENDAAEPGDSAEESEPCCEAEEEKKEEEV